MVTEVSRPTGQEAEPTVLHPGTVAYCDFTIVDSVDRSEQQEASYIPATEQKGTGRGRKDRGKGPGAPPGGSSTPPAWNRHQPSVTHRAPGTDVSVAPSSP